jgi:cobalt-zinc-cadmium efflux system protein
MAHAHHHGATHAGQRLAWSTVITLSFVVTEVIAGYFSNSLALLSDAGHNFADALALIIAWYGVWIAQKPSTARRTFGYHRVGTLAALVNSVSLVVIALLIFWEAAQRLGRPAPVRSSPMIIVAAVAIAMNAAISFWLRRDAKKDLNIRSAYIHMVGDAISALGVVIAGVIVALTGASIADPLVSILIGMLILASSWGILKESVDILLEAMPAGMNIAEVEATIARVHGVLAVHDLHVWTIGSGMVCCSCHVMVNEQSVRSGENVLRGVNEQLRSRFSIDHTTIQVEVEGCDPNDMFCLQKIAQHHH